MLFKPDTVRGHERGLITPRTADEIAQVLQKCFFPGRRFGCRGGISTNDTYTKFKRKVFDWIELGHVWL